MNTTIKNEKKMTKVEKFALLRAIPAVAENPLLTEFIDHEVELLQKKNSGEHKPTKAQTANVALQNAIFTQMEDNRLYTITELTKEISELAELSNQKVSALLRALRTEHKVERIEEKGKPFYTVIR